ncbi:6476_t:CDS:2, partial [Acaulospora colombiana]
MDITSKSSKSAFMQLPLRRFPQVPQVPPGNLLSDEGFLSGHVLDTLSRPGLPTQYIQPLTYANLSAISAVFTV